MPPITSEDLEEFHRKSEAKASKSFSTFLDRNNKKFKIPIQATEKWSETLEELISETLSHFQRLHQKKMEGVKAQALKEMVKAEQEFTNEIKKLSAEDEERFDLEASLCKGQAKSRLEASIDVSVTGKEIYKEVLSEWDTKAGQLLDHFKILMRKEYKEKIENFKARNNASKVEEQLRAEAEKILVTTMQTFDSQTSDLKNRLRMDLENSMDVASMGQQSVQEIMSAWDSNVQVMLRDYNALFRKQNGQHVEKTPAPAIENATQAPAI